MTRLRWGDNYAKWTILSASFLFITSLISAREYVVIFGEAAVQNLKKKFRLVQELHIFSEIFDLLFYYAGTGCWQDNLYLSFNLSNEGKQIYIKK